jgi:hypothetical protein
MELEAWRLVTITVLLLMWNLGLVYQWTTNLMAIRTQVYWDQVLYNQFRVVPRDLLHDLAERFLLHRNAGV